MAEKTIQHLLKESSGYEAAGNEVLDKLPVSQKKRVCALKKIQLGIIDVEAEFYERVHLLEKEFEAKFNKFYEKRAKIVTGEYEPTDEESDIPLVHGLDSEELKKMYDSSEADKGEKGIPEFWLNVLRGSEVITDMIKDHDEPVLKHLTNITSSVELEPPGFTLYFHFSPNPFFSNTVLKKRYDLVLKPDPEEPFDYDGPTVVDATGDEINWSEGKNVTRKVIKKKAKKGANSGKFLTKTVDNESFFTFFTPPKNTPSTGHGGESDEDFTDQDLKRADYEVGQVIRDFVIPRAVLFFTGETDLGDDDMVDFDGDEEDDEEDFSDDEE